MANFKTDKCNEILDELRKDKSMFETSCQKLKKQNNIIFSCHMFFSTVTVVTFVAIPVIGFPINLVGAASCSLGIMCGIYNERVKKKKKISSKLLQLNQLTDCEFSKKYFSDEEVTEEEFIKMVEEFKKYQNEKEIINQSENLNIDRNFAGRFSFLKKFLQNGNGTNLSK